MIDVIIYEIGSGRILRWGSVPEYSKHMQAEDGQNVYEGSYLDPELWYFTWYGKPAARPALEVETNYEITADGVDAVELALPAGTVIIDLETRERFEDEDELFFSTEIPGMNRFRIVPPMPYQEFEVTIRAD